MICLILQHSQQTFGCLLGTVDWCFFPIKMESLNLMSTWVKGMPSDQHPFLRRHFNTFAFSKLQLQQSGDPTAGAEQCISHPSEEVYMQEELTRDLNTKLPPATKAGWLAEVLPRCSSFGGFGYNCLQSNSKPPYIYREWVVQTINIRVIYYCF